MKKVNKKSRCDLATIFFIGIIIIAIIGASLPINTGIIWLLLGICGAIVAIQNIQIKEEDPFLIGISALIIVLIAFLLIPEFGALSNSPLGTLFVNLIVGFGISGFIVALGLIARLGLEK